MMSRTQLGHRLLLFLGFRSLNDPTFPANTGDFWIANWPTREPRPEVWDDEKPSIVAEFRRLRPGAQPTVKEYKARMARARKL
jgi:hypothetical protein